MKKLYSLSQKVSWKIILVLYILQIVLFQFMAHITFPVIQENLGNLKMFDMMKKGYDVSTVNSILQIMGEQGQHVYLFRQMPIDFVYPVLMAVVYYLILVKTSTTFRYSYYIFPILLVAFDWTENICIILMLTGHQITEKLVTCSSFCTQAKAIVGDYILYIAMIISIAFYMMKCISSIIKKR